MLKMKYPFYFMNWLNNAIIKLNFIIVDSVIIAGGCTKFIQAPDVSWNKPMKEYLREIYDNWLAESKHQMTTHGNMKQPSRQQMIEWVLDAWKMLPADVLKKSFKVCALLSNLDGSEDQIMSRHSQNSFNLAKLPESSPTCP